MSIFQIALEETAEPVVEAPAVAASDGSAPGGGAAAQPLTKPTLDPIAVSAEPGPGEDTPIAPLSAEEEAVVIPDAVEVEESETITDDVADIGDAADQVVDVGDAVSQIATEGREMTASEFRLVNLALRSTNLALGLVDKPSLAVAAEEDKSRLVAAQESVTNYLEATLRSLLGGFIYVGEHFVSAFQGHNEKAAQLLRDLRKASDAYDAGTPVVGPVSVAALAALSINSSEKTAADIIRNVENYVNTQVRAKPMVKGLAQGRKELQDAIGIIRKIWLVSSVTERNKLRGIIIRLRKATIDFFKGGGDLKLDINGKHVLGLKTNVERENKLTNLGERDVAAPAVQALTKVEKDKLVKLASDILLEKETCQELERTVKVIANGYGFSFVNGNFRPLNVLAVWLGPLKKLAIAVQPYDVIQAMRSTMEMELWRKIASVSLDARREVAEGIIAYISASAKGGAAK